MTAQEFEKYMQWVEGRNRGWIRGGDFPRCKALLDGKEITNVLSVNRRKGVVRMSPMPFRLDKHRKRVLSYTLRGNVRLELM